MKCKQCGKEMVGIKISDFQFTKSFPQEANPFKEIDTMYFCNECSRQEFTKKVVDKKE